jgi:hypothetical protein
VADVLATPVLWLGEVGIVLLGADHEDVRVRWGPLGFTLSLLPFVTCVPLVRPSSALPISTPLELTAADRAELRALGEGAGVEWLARRHAARDPARAQQLAADVRALVRGVRLAPYEAARVAPPRDLH